MRLRQYMRCIFRLDGLSNQSGSLNITFQHVFQSQVLLTLPINGLKTLKFLSSFTGCLSTCHLENIHSKPHTSDKAGPIPGKHPFI